MKHFKCVLALMMMTVAYGANGESKDIITFNPEHMVWEIPGSVEFRFSPSCIINNMAPPPTRGRDGVYSIVSRNLDSYDWDERIDPYHVDCFPTVNPVAISKYMYSVEMGRESLLLRTWAGSLRLYNALLDAEKRGKTVTVTTKTLFHGSLNHYGDLDYQLDPSGLTAALNKIKNDYQTSDELRDKNNLVSTHNRNALIVKVVLLILSAAIIWFSKNLIWKFVISAVTLSKQILFWIIDIPLKFTWLYQLHRQRKLRRIEEEEEARVKARLKAEKKFGE